MAHRLTGDNNALSEVGLSGRTQAQRRILAAAVESMSDLGYHGSTTRGIAKAAGQSPSALYVYYRTKEELLFEICLVAHQSVLKWTEQADSQSMDAVERLASVTRSLTQWHATNHAIARVAQFELPLLTLEHFQIIALVRRRIEHHVRDIVRDGASTGQFTVDDVTATSTAILSLTIDVARLFRLHEHHSAVAILDLYETFALRMVGVLE